MTSNKIRPGANYCMGNSINVTTEGQSVFYPDSLNVGTAPAGSTGLAKTISDSDFNYATGKRGALLRSFWMGLGANAGVEIRSHDGTVLYFSFAGAAFGPTSLVFGPEGVALPDGFRIDILGSPSVLIDFVLTYEII